MTERQSYSPHHSGKRKQPITAIILHDTGGHTAAGTLDWFARKESGVSSHVVIDRDGTIWRVIGDDYVAWHAGKSSLDGVAGVNAFSLGVELVDCDDGASDPYPAAQYQACVQWCVEAVRRYGISVDLIVGHCDVAPGRKVDPGPDFPWVRFRVDVRQGLLAL